MRDAMAERFNPLLFLEQATNANHSSRLRIRYCGHGHNWVELALPYDRELAADATSGVLSSGPIISLMDMAAGCAVFIRSGAKAQATLDLRVDYLRPSQIGQDVFGRGECYRVTRRIAFVRGMAHDGDPTDPVAHIAGTFMFTDVD
jgi:uncharacterized protein (TIGR00369 family)